MTFDSYPSKSCVQDLNLFKSDFGSENAYVKDKIHTFQFFKAASLRSAALFKMCLGTNRMNSTLEQHNLMIAYMLVCNFVKSTTLLIGIKKQ